MGNLVNFTIKLTKTPPESKKKLLAFKRQWAKSYQEKLPKNSPILKIYKSLVQKGCIKANSHLENLLKLKRVRSQSGIIPVAVLTKPYPCPGKCIYCPSQKGIPKSYLSDEPAVLRARMFKFDPYKQTKIRIKQLRETGHSTDKIELIIIGGTFSYLPKKYQQWFIKRCFDAANGKASKTFQNAQKINEKANCRIIGLTLETRPDFINEKEIKWFRKLGCTRVEIGVQSLSNKILKRVKRGHTIAQVAKATKLLKDAGFKVCYHMMPNLPNSTPKEDLKGFKKLFSDERFKPDMLKIYPTMVIPSAQLFKWYKKGLFNPYSDKQLINLVIKIKQIVPPWVRINRLTRDIPAGNIAAGSKLSNIRQILQQKMSSRGRSTAGRKCQCIRCREIKYQQLAACRLKLVTSRYHASGGKEYFLQVVDDKNRLYGLLRLRFPSQISKKKRCFIKELINAAIIRELHVFGEAVKLGESKKEATQHKGLGEKLLKKAERFVQNNGFRKIAVIAGIGSREYYRKLDYRLQGTYMIKYL